MSVEAVDLLVPMGAAAIGAGSALLAARPTRSALTITEVAELLDPSVRKVVHGSLRFKRGKTAEDVFDAWREFATVPREVSVTFNPDANRAARILTDTFAVYMCRHSDSKEPR